MAFHETFWVVVGAAAPVIALACVVSAVDPLGFMSVFTGRTRRASRGQTLMKWTYALGSANLTVQAVVLYFALYSLAYRRDAVSPWFSIWAETLGITALFVAAGMKQFLSYWAVRFKEGKPSLGDRPERLRALYIAEASAQLDNAIKLAEQASREGNATALESANAYIARLRAELQRLEQEQNNAKGR